MSNFNLTILTKEILKNNILDIISMENETSKSLGTELYGCAWNAKNFLIDIEGKWEYSSVAIKNNKVVAYLIVSKWGNNIHGHRMAMHKNCSSIEKVKLANALYETTKEIAKKNKIQSITAIVPENNKQTQHYYKKNKFIELNSNQLKAYIGAKGVSAFICETNILVDKIKEAGQPSRSFVYQYFY